MKQSGYYRQIPPDYYLIAAKKRPQIHPILGLFFIIFPALAGLKNAAIFAAPPDPATRPSQDDSRIAPLMLQLGSEDASQRQSATARLIAIGLPARPAILSAVHSDDPGIREQAAQILLALPWFVPDDPVEIQNVLVHYGNPDIGARRQLINILATMNTHSAYVALGRLLEDDPSVDVRWTIVTHFRDHDDGFLLTRFKAIAPPADDAPMLALCGYAHYSSDPAVAQKFLAESATLELNHPSDDEGEFDQVIASLCDLECKQRNYAQAADWRRKQFAHGSEGDEQGIPPALLELFVLHANYGPLPAFKDDLLLMGDFKSSAKFQYAMSRLDARQGKQAQSDAERASALAASVTRSQHYEVGDFLAAHDWDDLAAVEYNQVLKMPPGPDDVGRPLDASAHLELAALATKHHDDLTIAQQKEMAMNLLGSHSPPDPADAHPRENADALRAIWTDIYWHYFRAAIADKNEFQIQRNLDALMKLHPTDEDLVTDVVPTLQARHQTKEADALFGWAFAAVQDRMNADPDNPTMWNAAAWLCARCDRNLEQSLTWSQRAVDAMPDNSATIDTLAEVNFHLNHPRESVRLETHALELTPDDPFMTDQLHRFATAAATQPASQP